MTTIWTQQWTPAASQNFPELYRQKNPQHTACKPPNSWCKIKDSGVDDTQRALILKLHNEYRSEIARGKVEGFKPAANMQELLWDPDLEYVAQAHANLCTTPNGDLRHDKVRDRFTPRFQDVGQNLAWRGRSYSDGGPNWTYPIFGWYLQHKLFPPSYVSCLRVPVGVKTGHFSQLVWPRTRYVGCGYVYYPVDKARYPHMKHYACDYGPSGNYLRSAVYREGSTSSACPAPTQCNKLSGLCDGTSRIPDVTKMYVAPRTTITTWRPETTTPPLSATIPLSQATSDATFPPITFLCTEPPTPHLHTELPPRQEPMTETPYAPDPNPKPYPIPDPEDARPTPPANPDIFLSEVSQLSAAIDDAFRELDSIVAAYRDINEEENSALPFIAGGTAAAVVATLAAYFIF